MLLEKILTDSRSQAELSDNMRITKEYDERRNEILESD